MTDDAKITAASALLDFITDRLTHTRLLFASEAESAAAFHKGATKSVKTWAKPAVCMFPGCGKRSIAASHTLQRAGPITTLLEDHHVYTPRSHMGVISMVRVGASDASTFPGFCGEHELLFASFEMRKTIETGAELDLQIFRTLCREIRRKEHDLKRLDGIMIDLKRRLDAEVAREARRLKIDFKSFSTEGTRWDDAEDHLAEGRGILADLRALHTSHWPAIGGSGASGLEGVALQIDLAFPVTLSGMVPLNYRGVPYLCLLGVIPQAQGALIFMVGGPGSTDAIEACLPSKGMDLPLIDVVERWMIRCTDHWFLRPSVWDAIPVARQEALLALLADAKSGIGDPVPLSIFDDMRRTALAAPMADPPAVGMVAYANAQRAKITPA